MALVTMLSNGRMCALSCLCTYVTSTDFFVKKVKENGKNSSGPLSLFFFQKNVNTTTFFKTSY